MPRAEVGSQKWLANKMKAKGLQKLKWYCQMCEKQCRDENGFKCHRLSEGHQRMMQVFCQNSGRFMDTFSRAFEHEFMKLMRTRYCKTKILANSVYQEVISDKQHVHMNATVWVTLSEFVLYLGRSGKCKVEDSPRGWMIEYIDQDKIRREQDAEEKRKREISLEQRHQKVIQKMVEEARKRGGFQEPEYTPMMKEGDEKVRIETKLKPPTPSDAPPEKKVNIFKQLSKKVDSKSTNSIGESQNPQNTAFKRKSAMDVIMEQNMQKHRKKEETKEVAPAEVIVSQEEGSNNSWLIENIVVKVILKSHPLYKHKCKVIGTTHGGSRAAVQDIDGSGEYQVLDDHVETVVPPVGSKVMLVRGTYRKSTGTLTESHHAELRADIKLDNGKLLENVHYDDFSQVDE